MNKRQLSIVFGALVLNGISCQSAVNLQRDEFKKATIATLEDSSYIVEDKAFTDSLESQFLREIPDTGTPSAKVVIKYAADKDDGSAFNKEAILSLDGETFPVQVKGVESEVTLKVMGPERDAKVKTGQMIGLTAEINFSQLHIERLAKAKTIALRLYLGPTKKTVTVNYSAKVIERIQQWASVGRN